MLTRYRKSTPSYATFNRDPLLSFVDRFFNEVGYPTQENSGESRDWVPAVDIQETEDAFLATADLPGLSKDDIDVSLEDGVLTIAGERRFQNDEEEGKTFRRIERAYGSFRRSFTLPQGVDPENVEANFNDGVLHLTLPKSPTAKARKIAIS